VIAKAVSVLLVSAVLGAGCVGTAVQFADPPMDKLDLSRGTSVMGAASGLSLFECIPIGINQRHARAYDRMQRKVPYQHLTNITVQDSWKWAFIGYKYSTIMRATAYPLKTDTPKQPSGGSTTLAQKLDELKSLYDKGLLTDAEYESARKRALGI
jgi:hypothetical protein